MSKPQFGRCDATPVSRKSQSQSLEYVLDTRPQIATWPVRRPVRHLKPLAASGSSDTQKSSVKGQKDKKKKRVTWGLVETLELLLEPISSDGETEVTKSGRDTAFHRPACSSDDDSPEAGDEDENFERGESDSLSSDVAEDLDAIEAVEFMNSVGSLSHSTGYCTGCQFFAEGRCQDGRNCSLCHFPRKPRSEPACQDIFGKVKMEEIEKQGKEAREAANKVVEEEAWRIAEKVRHEAAVKTNTKVKLEEAEERGREAREATNKVEEKEVAWRTTKKVRQEPAVKTNTKATDMVSNGARSNKNGHTSDHEEYFCDTLHFSEPLPAKSQNVPNGGVVKLQELVQLRLQKTGWQPWAKAAKFTAKHRTLTLQQRIGLRLQRACLQVWARVSISSIPSDTIGELQELLMLRHRHVQPDLRKDGILSLQYCIWLRLQRDSLKSWAKATTIAVPTESIVKLQKLWMMKLQRRCWQNWAKAAQFASPQHGILALQQRIRRRLQRDRLRAWAKACQTDVQRTNSKALAMSSSLSVKVETFMSKGNFSMKLVCMRVWERLLGRTLCDFQVCRTQCSVYDLHGEACGNLLPGELVTCSLLTMNGYLKLVSEKEAWVKRQSSRWEECNMWCRGTPKLATKEIYSQGIGCFEVVKTPAHMHRKPCPECPVERQCVQGEYVFAWAQNFNGWVQTVDKSGWIRAYSENNEDRILRARPSNHVETVDLRNLDWVWSLVRESKGTGQALTVGDIQALKKLEKDALSAATVSFDRTYGPSSDILKDSRQTAESRRLFFGKELMQLMEDEGARALGLLDQNVEFVLECCGKQVIGTVRV